MKSTYDLVMRHTMQSLKHLKYCHHSPDMWYHNTESKQASRVRCTTFSNRSIWNLWLNRLNCMSTPVHHHSTMLFDILVNKVVSNRYLESNSPGLALQPLAVPIPDDEWKIKQTNHHQIHKVFNENFNIQSKCKLCRVTLCVRLIQTLPLWCRKRLLYCPISQSLIHQRCAQILHWSELVEMHRIFGHLAEYCVPNNSDSISSDG